MIVNKTLNCKNIQIIITRNKAACMKFDDKVRIEVMSFD